jgi:cysteine desulfurase
VELASLLHGGGQERGARAGTESTLLIAALGAAADVARRDLAAAAKHAEAVRDELEALLLAAFKGGGARVNGPAERARRLPNTLSISVRSLRAGALLSELSDRLAASAAAACHGAGGGAGSPVLRAMGVPPELAAGTLRLSTGRFTSMEEVRRAAALIAGAAARQGVAVAAPSSVTGE